MNDNIRKAFELFAAKILAAKQATNAPLGTANGTALDREPRVTVTLMPSSSLPPAASPQKKQGPPSEGIEGEWYLFTVIHLGAPAEQEIWVKDDPTPL